MMRASQTAVAAMVALGLGVAMGAQGGCVGSNATHCDGLVCPSGTTCAPQSGPRCIDSDLVDACRGKSDGATCSVSGLPDGTCSLGVCQTSRCGDARVTGAEECDGTDFDERTCQTVGFYESAGLACNDDCTYNTTACAGKCGDGVKNGPERCDGADLGASTCFDAGYYAATGLACAADCSFDTAQCTGGKCGDGVINGLEQCDGATTATTCAGLGFSGAMSGLACSSSCTYSGSSCMCASGTRCTAWDQRCDCPKTGGCGCVAAR